MLAALLVGCARERAATTAGSPDTLAASAILRDRPATRVLPLAPAGAGEWALAQVAEVRESLAVTSLLAEPLAPALPEAAPAPPPLVEGVATAESHTSLELKPPIPRGAPVLPRGGRGGRVVLDVRVDEEGRVSDVEPVDATADPATVEAAVQAAFASRWYPALLGTARVAVWTRQVFEVARGR